MVMFFYLAGISFWVSTALVLIALIILFLSVFVPCMLEDTEKTYIFKWKHTLIPVSVSMLLFVLIAFIPSKETMYTMAAAYGVQEAVQNKDVQRIAGKSLSVIENELDKYLAEDK